MFDPPALGVLDLSDVSVLSTVPSIVGTLDEDNLLIYSQESAKLLEVSPAGAVLCSFDFALLSSTAEGVTIDTDGVIYVVDESAEPLRAHAGPGALEPRRCSARGWPASRARRRRARDSAPSA